MRRVLRVGGVILILLTVLLAGRLGSETRPKPEPRSRIALVNLAQVSKGYAKVADFTAVKKQLVKPFEVKIKDLKEQIEAHLKALEKKDLAEETRSQHEKKLKERQQKMADLTSEASQILARKNAEQLVLVYKDVLAAAQRHAKTHGIDLVLQYSDLPADAADFFSPVNVARKVELGAAFPLVIAPGLDITQDILTDLNDAYRKEKSRPGSEEP